MLFSDFFLARAAIPEPQQMVNEFGDGETLCPDALRAVLTPLFVMGKAEVTAAEVTA